MRILLLHLIMLLFLSGCSVLYLPASMGATTQPVYISPKTAPPANSFLAVEYNKAVAWGEGDKNSLTKFNFARNVTYKYLLLQFDATVFQGQYTVASVPGYLGAYDYFGVNGASRMALKLPLNEVHLVFGYGFELNIEGGDYYDFRKAAAADDLINTTETRLCPGFNNFLGMYIQTNDDCFFAVQADMGLPGFFSSNVMYFTRDIGGWISYTGSNSDDLQTEKDESYKVFSIGLGWKL